MLHVILVDLKTIQNGSEIILYKRRASCHKLMASTVVEVHDIQTHKM